MKWLVLASFIFLSSLSYSLEPEEGEEPIMLSDVVEVSTRTQKMADQFEKDVKRGRLKQKTQRATDAMIKLAHYKLYRIGKKEYADKLLKEWNEQYSFYFDETRCEGITCHEPLSKWLAQKTLELEFILGKDVMHALRLDDLITINYSLKILFACPHDVTEHDFYLHMVSDDIHGYRGLMPVVSHWVTEIGCLSATLSSGFLFCAPISMGVELLTKWTIAPKLSPIVYNWSCKGEIH